MTEKELEKKQYSLVVKSNELIRKTRFSLSVVEQKVLLYIISKIKPGDNVLLEYELDIREFCEVCGIEYFQNMSQVKETIQSLRDKSMWLRLSDKEEVLVSWINKARIHYGTGTMTVRLDDDLLPYLLQLKDNFTKYELIAILALKSKFSIRLYELFKSYEYKKEFEIAVEDLRKMLMIETEYPKMADFKRYVIDRAIDEINRFTDIEVEYEPVRKGKFITAFRFRVEQDPDFDGRYTASHLFIKGVIPTRHKIDKEFREMVANNQMTLWEDEEI